MMQMYKEKDENNKERKDKKKLKKRKNKEEYRIDIKENNTKVLVLDSSPKMENGNTYLILKPFIEGMRSEGADVEVIQLYKLNILPCKGEFQCWKETPGECVQDDDMHILYPKIKNADIIVLVSPVYWSNINAKMKSVIDRMLPLIEPYIISINGRTRHILRKGIKTAKVVLISTCGDWEMDNFYHMTDYIREFCKSLSYEYCGELLRPHAEIMKQNKDLNFIFDAARSAGEKFIKVGFIDGEMSRIVCEDLMDREDYIKDKQIKLS